MLQDNSHEHTHLRVSGPPPTLNARSRFGVTSSVANVSTPTPSAVRCDESYKGSRCEQFQLFSSSDTAGQAGLIAALVIVALLLLAILAVVVYFIRK